MTELPSLLDEAGTGRVWAVYHGFGAGSDSSGIIGIDSCRVALCCNLESTSIPEDLEVDLASLALELGTISFAITTEYSSVSIVLSEFP